MRRSSPTADMAKVAFIQAVMDDLAGDLPRLSRTLVDERGYAPARGFDGAPPGTVATDPVAAAAIAGDPTAADRELLTQGLDALVEWARELDAVRRRWKPSYDGLAPCKLPGGCPLRYPAAPGRGGLCKACAERLRRARLRGHPIAS